MNNNQTLIVVFGAFAIVALIAITVISIYVPNSSSTVALIFTGVGSIGASLLTLRSVGEVNKTVDVVRDEISSVKDEVKSSAAISSENADAIQAVHDMVDTKNKRK